MEQEWTSPKRDQRLAPGTILGLVPNQSPFSFIGRNDQPSFFSWRRSLDASASSQSRKVTIFGCVAVAFGQTIQYVFERRSDSGNGRTSRPLIISQAARVVRASAMPWPLVAASITMLARFNTGPCMTSAPSSPAACNQFCPIGPTIQMQQWKVEDVGGFVEAAES